MHRKFLESKGFEWAPFNVAKEFSIETPLSFEDLKKLPFGFHGKRMLFFISLRQKLRNLIRFLYKYELSKLIKINKKFIFFEKFSTFFHNHPEI